MDYTELTDEHRETLRRERILALESDHYRTELLIAESGNYVLREQLAALERRIATYSAPLSPEPAEASTLESAEEPPR